MDAREERVSLKVTSFNVNSLKSCLKRTGHKSLQEFLDSFDSDIVCLQELKLSTEEAFKWKEWAGLETWVAFCDFATNRNGYSGTGTFVKTAVCLPEKVEIGLIPKDDPLEDFASWNEERLAELNQEGRVVVTHHGGDFVLFNLYGPAISSDEEEKMKIRMEYKMDFFKVLERRMMSLKMRDNNPCRIVVVGDFNIAPSPCDYPGPIDPQFYRNSRPDRLWMKSLLSGGDDHPLNLRDAFRVFHPNRKNAFTVWDTKTNARIHNHGSRIDLTLVSGFEMTPNEEGLSGCCYIMMIINADICPDIHGSDHCPVFVEIGKVGTWTCSDMIPPESICRIIGSDSQKKITSFLVPVRLYDQRQEEEEAGLCDLPSLGTKRKRKQIDLKTLFSSKKTSTDNIPDHLRSDYAASEAYFTSLHNTAKTSWASIQQKMKAPMCSCQIPAAKKKVTKSTSKKKGSFFYCCSKPAGGGNCNFFQWLS